MANLAQMEQELIVERTRAVAGSRDRTLRVWVAERRGDYHLHRRGSYLQLCLRSGRANEYCRRRARPSAFPAARRSRHKNTASNRQYKDRAPHLFEFPTEAYMNLKLFYMLASAVTNASNWIYDWLRSFSRYLTLPLWRTEKRLCKTG
jgi:hypothetical protein